MNALFRIVEPRRGSIVIDDINLATCGLTARVHVTLRVPARC